MLEHETIKQGKNNRALAAHSCLHLQDHDHIEAEEMEGIEKVIMKNFGFEDPDKDDEKH